MSVSRGNRIVSPLRGSTPFFASYPGLTPWATFLTRLPALDDQGKGNINRSESNLAWTKSF